MFGDTGRRQLLKTGASIVALSAGASVPGLARPDPKKMYEKTIELRKRLDWTTEEWRDHLADKRFEFQKKDVETTSDVGVQFEKGNSKIKMTFTTDYNTTFRPTIDFTYVNKQLDAYEPGYRPLDRVCIGYNNDEFVRSDYYTGPYTAKQDNKNCFGPTGSCLGYSDYDSYYDQPVDSDGDITGFYGEYVKVKDQGSPDTRKIFFDWYHTSGTVSLDGISFSPYPAPVFSGGSEQWVKEDEAFQADI
ncbi:hypothetical protein [Halobaculum sp. MBLA0143]|uniref:hypothetical protein n=1 Tax=Halobaculum sp. MBLA0143 TaxID=3079933 RepID=UPI003524695F